MSALSMALLCAGAFFVCSAFALVLSLAVIKGGKGPVLADQRLEEDVSGDAPPGPGEDARSVRYWYSEGRNALACTKTDAMADVLSSSGEWVEVTKEQHDSLVEHSRRAEWTLGRPEEHNREETTVRKQP